MICCIPFPCFVLCIPGDFSISSDEVAEMSEMSLPKLVMDSVEFMMSFIEELRVLVVCLVELLKRLFPSCVFVGLWK